MRVTTMILIVIGGVVVVMLSTPIIVYLLRLVPLWRPSVGLDGKEWLAFYAVLTAVLGWLFAAWVQVRNSIKQHTINTLLQSRLSSSFQEKAALINTTYYVNLEPVLISAADFSDKDKQAALHAFRYMLNYYEFIAVGIRNGDFDEKLMRLSWRGIVTNLVNQADVLIQQFRGTNPDGKTANPLVYENLLWLYEKWKVPAVKS